METDLIKRWGLDLLIDEIHGKVNRKSSNVFKTSKTRYKVFFVYCYDPAKPERKTYRRWKNRDNLRYATQLAKLDYNNYPAERAKYEEAFAQQDKYKSLFHYIVACHKLALDRADAMAQKPSGKALEWLNMFFVMQHVGCTKKNDALAKDLASESFAKICNALNRGESGDWYVIHTTLRCGESRTSPQIHLP